MRAGFLMLSLATLLPVGLVRADEMQACYGIELPAESGPIKSIITAISTRTNSQLVFDLELHYWAEPGLIGGSGGFCSERDGTYACGVDCSAGGMDLKPMRGDVALLRMMQLEILTNFVSEAQDGDGYDQETGTYFLTRRDFSQCTFHPWNTVQAGVALEPGDVSRYVQQAERALSELGYPVGAIDRVYEPETQQAVRSFQHSVGLPDDGRIDERTLTELSVHSELQGGC